MRRIAGVTAALLTIVLVPGCAAGDGQSKTVSKSSLPGWPLTVDSGVLECEGSGGMGKVTFVVDGKTYGVNGTARADQDNLDIQMLWADAETAGLKKDISPLIDEGLKLCE